METKAAIIQLLTKHLEKYPSDKKSLNNFFTFLHTTEITSFLAGKTLLDILLHRHLL